MLCVLALLLMPVFSRAQTEALATEPGTGDEARGLESGTAARRCVVLLHGLGRLSSSMGELGRKLERSGFLIANIGYPSRSMPINELAKLAVREGIDSCREQGSDEPFSFVTHSLGGILVRAYTSEFGSEFIDHVVMLGPPNQGSRLVDGMSGIPGFRFVTGPAGMELASGDNSIIQQLGPVDFDLGVIAGDSDLYPMISFLLKGPSDGIVSVESTRVEGMKEHIVLPVTHTFMMHDNEVIDHVLHYLNTGSFIPVD